MINSFLLKSNLVLLMIFETREDDSLLHFSCLGVAGICLNRKDYR